MKVFDESIGLRIIKRECFKMPIHSRVCIWCGKPEREDFTEGFDIAIGWECPECLEALKRLILKERANNEQAEKGR